MGHRYTMKYRPIDTFHLPPGKAWKVVERDHDGTYALRLDLPMSAHRFGVVEYEQPLTQAEIDKWEMIDLNREDR